MNPLTLKDPAMNPEINRIADKDEDFVASNNTACEKLLAAIAAKWAFRDAEKTGNRAAIEEGRKAWDAANGDADKGVEESEKDYKKACRKAKALIGCRE